MATEFHRDAPLLDIHIIHQREFADSAARLGYAYTSADVGKVFRQLDTNQWYILADESPVTFRGPLNSGGGGGGFQWFADSNAPAASSLNGVPIYSFTAALAQQLYGNLKVPNAYAAGSAIYLLTNFYSNDTSGNVLFKAQSTLHRVNNDSILTDTNQTTSSNAAVTLSGATQNKLQAVLIDLSSAAGLIGGQAVAASDSLKVRLYRDTDTATGLAVFLPGLTDFLFG